MVHWITTLMLSAIIMEKDINVGIITKKNIIAEVIVAIELFDSEYLNMICGLGLPTIMIDSPIHAFIHLFPCDFVSMENVASTATVVQRIIDLGARRIGFVGDRDHCGSFYDSDGKSGAGAG